jgi:metal transporter CNNM
MIEGALQMKTSVALDVYTPLRRVFAVPETMNLSERAVVRIYASGFSRLPVYRENPEKPKDKTAIIGVLLTKQLIVLNPDDERPLSSMPLYTPLCVSPNVPLVNLVNIFQTGGKAQKGGHLALVCARPQEGNLALASGQPLPARAGLMGVITLEDVLECLLQEQIYDENDVRPTLFLTVFLCYAVFSTLLDSYRDTSVMPYVWRAKWSRTGNDTYGARKRAIPWPCRCPNPPWFLSWRL